MSESADYRHSRHRILSISIISGLLLTLLISSVAPRILGFAPPVIGLIATLAYTAGTRKLPDFSKEFLFWAAAISALIFMSSLWSVTPEITIERGGKIFVLLFGSALLFSTLRSTSPLPFQFLSLALPVTVLAMGIVNVANLYMDGVLHQFVRSEPITQENGFELFEINRSVVLYTIGFILALPMLIYASVSKMVKTIVGLALTALTILIMIKTDSQSAHFALALGLIFLVFFPYRFKTAWIGVFVILSALMILAPFIAQWMLPNLALKLDQYSWFHDGYTRNRLEIWDFISRYALQNPLYGYGAEATRSITFDHAMLYYQDRSVLHPHNFALQLWIEFGVIGIAFATAFFARILYIIITQSALYGPQAGRFALPLLFTFLAVSSTGYGLWQGWWVGSFALFIPLSYLSINNLGKEENS